MRPIIPTNIRIAKGNITEGDCVKFLWKKYCRRCDIGDKIISGIASETKRHGKKIKLYKLLPGLYWETEIK